MKKCFHCKQLLQLDSFAVTKMKYQLKSDHGRAKVCVDCCIEIATEKMSCIKHIDGEWKVFNFKSKEEIIEFYEKDRSNKTEKN